MNKEEYNKAYEFFYALAMENKDTVANDGNLFRDNILTMPIEGWMLQEFISRPKDIKDIHAWETGAMAGTNEAYIDLLHDDHTFISEFN